MKRISPRTILQITGRYWILIVVAITTLGAGGLFAQGQKSVSVHEGGLLQATQAPKQVAKLPDAAAELATTAQSVAVAPSSCSQNGPGKLLLVSISQQHIWACNGTDLAKESAVTTGASALTNVDNATPTGTWHISSKQTNRHLKGCDVNGCWDDPVAYWIPYDGDIGFHDSAWQTFPYGSSLYTTQGSHGCVHLPADMAAWVYGWAPVGTTVTVKA